MVAILEEETKEEKAFITDKGTQIIGIKGIDKNDQKFCFLQSNSELLIDGILDVINNYLDKEDDVAIEKLRSIISVIWHHIDVFKEISDFKTFRSVYLHENHKIIICDE